MLALDDYEQSLCPECGMPMGECHDELAPTRWDAEAGVCQIGVLRRLTSDQWRRDHNGENPARLDSLTVTVKPR